MNAFVKATDLLQVAEPISHANLELIPLILRDKPFLERPIKTLDEALAEGTFEVGEVSEQGSVGDLKVENKGDEPVLIIEGEELVGAKQNRIVNLTILVPPKSALTIPVTCIEEGRWGYGGWRRELRERSRPTMRSGGHVKHASARARMAEEVSCSLRSDSERRSDQVRTWATVRRALGSSGVESRTASLSDAYDGRSDEIDAYVAALKPKGGQVGAIYKIGDRIVGMDLLGTPEIFSKAFPKLIRGSALEAVSGLSEEGRYAGDGEAFIAEIEKTSEEIYDALGLGSDVRLSSEAITGGGLVLEEELVHLSAYPLAGA